MVHAVLCVWHTHVEAYPAGSPTPLTSDMAIPCSLFVASGFTLKHQGPKWGLPLAASEEHFYKFYNIQHFSSINILYLREFRLNVFTDFT